MGNQVPPIIAIFKHFFAQIGVTRSPISQARDLETKNWSKDSENLGFWVNSENYLAF